MQLKSLLDLAAEKAINDHRSLKGNLKGLPRTILNSLLVASIRQDRILTFQSLVIRWPFKELILRDCAEFLESHAVLLAGYLQKNRQNIDVVDIRGCEIGFLGTTVFCKSAIQHHLQNTYHPLESTANTQPVTHPSHASPLLTVLLDCRVNSENFEIVKQALVQHSFVNIKVCKLTVQEVGRAKVCSLVSLLETNIITSLDCQFNSLEQEGVVTLSKTLVTFVNLTELNLAYNCIEQNDTEAVNQIATVVSQMPKLKKLILSENFFGNKVVMILRNLVSPLTHLNLSGCCIRDAELRAMTEIEMLLHLEHLELSVNGLVDHVKSLSKFVCKSASTLRYLAIEDNMFTTRNVPWLCRMLKSLSVLRTLSICYNHLLNDDVDLIRKAIPDVEVTNKDYLF